MRQVCLLLLAFAVLCVCVDAAAGVLTKAQLARRFPAPLIVGDKEAGLSVWPVFKQNMTSVDLVGYVFESADLAPVPGFAGVPMNLLVAIDGRAASWTSPCCRSTSRCSSMAWAKGRCWTS